MAKNQPSLLDHAMAAEDNAEQLATGLAHAGADPKIVGQITQCAKLFREVVKALGSGPSLDQNSAQQQAQASGGPAGQGPPPNQGQQQAPPSPQAAPPQPAATQPSPKKQTQHHAFQAASHALQAAHAAANAKK